MSKLLSEEEEPKSTELGGEEASASEAPTEDFVDPDDYGMEQDYDDEDMDEEGEGEFTEAQLKELEDVIALNKKRSKKSKDKSEDLREMRKDQKKELRANLQKLDDFDDIED